MKLLLEHGADANAACDAGSPVMWAAGSGKSATLEALLQGGADPNTAGNSNVTAALAASASGTVLAIRVYIVSVPQVPSLVCIKTGLWTDTHLYRIAKKSLFAT